MTDRLLAALRPLAFAALFVLMGGFLAWTGGRQLLSASTLDDRGRHAVGTVLDTREKSSNVAKAPGRHTELQVEFTTADGTRRVFWGRGEAAAGGTVDVHYDPEDPGTAVIGAPPERSPLSVALVAVGGILVLVPPAVAVYRRRRRPPRGGGRPARGAHAAG